MYALVTNILKQPSIKSSYTPSQSNSMYMTSHRFPLYSEARNGIFKKYLMSWVKKIEESQNHLDDYIEMTRELEKVFKCNEFEDGPYYLCEKCKDIDKCYLTKRINKKGKLYHQLPEDIASRINDYYKKTIKIG